MSALYNELDPYAAQWLRNLSDAGHVNPGVVDARSIRELTPADLVGHTQAHFFAGIGVWSYALRRAGWPDDVPVWTGSCPCQPFSAAGRRGGFDDTRHLWPEWFRLIEQCRPSVILGEQVASPDGLKWFDLVSADLERAGYAVGAADLCAAGVGAPHLRQRLYFVAVSGEQRREGFGVHLLSGQPRPPGLETPGRGAVGSVAYANGGPSGESSPFARGRDTRGDALARAGLGGRGVPSVLGDAHDSGLEGRSLSGDGADQRPLGSSGVAGPVSGFWRDAEWLYCRDEKYRAVEPGTFPLAHGATARVGRLRAYGNAIVSEVAATFVRAVMDSLAPPRST